MLNEMKEALGATGMGPDAAGMILSTVLVSAIIVTLAWATGKKDVILPGFVLGFIVATGVGWVPPWALIATVALLLGLWALLNQSSR